MTLARYPVSFTRKGSSRAGLPGDWAAGAHCILKILPDVLQTVHVLQIGGAFKVVVQTPVVQIDGAYHGFPPVAEEDLGVDKAGGVLIELHTGGQQRLVVGLGQGVGIFLSGMPGRIIRTSTPRLAA